MKTESNVKPNEIIIERTNIGMCDVILNTEIKEIERDISQIGDSSEPTSMIVYEYESYRFELAYRSGLMDEIKNNFEMWIEYAKKVSNLSPELSEKEKIEYLLKENALLSSDNEMLKGCIMEIADVVFA